MAYCSECGVELREHAKFCDVCGTPRVVRTETMSVRKEVPAEENIPAPAEDNTPAPAEANTPAPAEDNIPTPAEANVSTPAEEPTSPCKWKAIVSFVTGLVSVLAPCLCCIAPLVMGFIGLVCGVTALVFAFLSRKDTGGHFCGMSIAGLILSIFGIFISLVVVVFAVVFLIAEPYMPDFDDYWSTYYWIKDTFGDDAASAYERIMSYFKG